MRKIRRRQRCPNCKSLDVIRWGNGRQRYHCSKQSLASLSGESGYSERQLRRWFSEYLETVPEWTIPRHKGKHLLIDGTWLPDGRCIIVYRDYDRKSITFLCRRHIANFFMVAAQIKADFSFLACPMNKFSCSLVRCINSAPLFKQASCSMWVPVVNTE